MAYTRKCPDWLDTFYKWIRPRSQAPDTYIEWTGLFCLSSAIRRKVYIPKYHDGAKKVILGGWDCYPHEYIIFVAPPGFGKTTTVRFATELLEEVTDLVQASNFLSSASLIKSLSESKDSSAYFTIEELGDLVNKTGLEMFDFLTSMYDGKRKLEANTLARGIEFANKPCINLIAGTTPQWIAGNMPESLIGGGFASRVIFIYEDQLYQKRMYYRDQINSGSLDQFKSDLYDDLLHIATDIEGQFDISDEAMDFMEHWYQKVHKPEVSHPKLQGYLQRKPTHIHKIAQLIHIARDDSLVLNKGDFEKAITIIEKTEAKLLHVFQGVGKNKYAIDMKGILSYIQENNGVTRTALLNEFESTAEVPKLLELVAGLIIMKQIKATMIDNGDVRYEVV